MQAGERRVQRLLSERQKERKKKLGGIIQRCRTPEPEESSVAAGAADDALQNNKPASAHRFTSFVTFGYFKHGNIVSINSQTE